MRFVEEVEGEYVANTMEIFFSIPRYQSFLNFCKKNMEYAPNTVGNKAKVLSQVILCLLSFKNKFIGFLMTTPTLREHYYEFNVCFSFLKSQRNKLKIVQRDQNNRLKTEEELMKAGRFLNV